jgi:hypothetical protein
MLSLLMLAGEYGEVRVVYWVQPFAHERAGGVVIRKSVNYSTLKWRQGGMKVPQRKIPVLHVSLYPAHSFVRRLPPDVRISSSETSETFKTYKVYTTTTTTPHSKQTHQIALSIQTKPSQQTTKLNNMAE